MLARPPEAPLHARSAVAPFPTWPDSVRRRYRSLGYWTDETFPAFVADRCERFAGNIAVVGRDAQGRDIRWTYADLAAAAERAAAHIAAAGVAPGDRVVVALPNIADFVAVIFGLFRLGALPIFALPSHRELELAQFCVTADAAAMVVATDDLAELHAVVAERVREQGVHPPALIDVRSWGDDELPPVPAPDRGPEDVAFLQLSGGTTGVAKLIPRTAADYLYSVRESATICGLTEESALLVVLPAAHNFPMSSPGILGVLHVGGRVVLAPDPSPRTAFALIESEGVTDASLVPPLAQAWVSAARRRTPDLSTLRTIQVGGAKLADSVAAEIGPVLGARLQQVFGMAEGLVNYTRLGDPDEIVNTTQGRPISAADEILIVDEDDNPVPDGVEGSLLTRGPYTIRGYYRPGDPDGGPNRDSFTSDGFYRTGDRVRRLPTGHLIVTGRDKDQINRAGEKVATDEIEGLVLAHPDVLDAVAVGLPDPYLGESICLVVRTEPGRPRPTDLAARLAAAGLASHKLPDRIEFLDAFPETHVGKNSRRELRQLLTEHLVPTPPADLPR
ncbi:MAG: AMP-binding protein [Tessaracoccus sp.]|uniref:(2,3-dihydroxybenzoyl)adenylate synthase n=1 Tax=Tessaracoccus sp. TaxID=1971211 RepID=UPI001EB722D9|nr:AMP-binding protein [Tessaracoccus sp.]MBK7822273.1 AMP-binding protein [Tessaracoccus sp.]